MKFSKAAQFNTRNNQIKNELNIIKNSNFHGFGPGSKGLKRRAFYFLEKKSWLR